MNTCQIGDDDRFMGGQALGVLHEGLGCKGL
jgi:hypothetical protein